MIVVFHPDDKHYSHSQARVLVPLRSLRLALPIHIWGDVRESNRHCSLRLQLVGLNDVCPSIVKLAYLAVISAFSDRLLITYTVLNPIQVYFLFRFPLLMCLSLRQLSLSVVRCTTSLDSVGFSKGGKKSTRCCPTVCNFLVFWLCVATVVRRNMSSLAYFLSSTKRVSRSLSGKAGALNLSMSFMVYSPQPCRCQEQYKHSCIAVVSSSRKCVVEWGLQANIRVKR